MLRISQIKRNAEKGEQGLKHAAAKELRIREEEIRIFGSANVLWMRERNRNCIMSIR